MKQFAACQWDRQWGQVSGNNFCLEYTRHRPLARYAKLRVAYAPGMPGTFSPPLQVSDPDMNHGTYVTHVPWCMPGSLTSGFLWNRWRGKHSQLSRRMRNPQFYVSGKGAHATDGIWGFQQLANDIQIRHTKRFYNHGHNICWWPCHLCISA